MSRESEQAFTPEDFQKRFDAAAEAAQREYCDIFEFWRACRLKACRRSKACGGDPQLCLKRGYAQVPDELSGRALARVIAATADDADRPTKLARQMSPQSFYLWPQVMRRSVSRLCSTHPTECVEDGGTCRCAQGCRKRSSTTLEAKPSGIWPVATWKLRMAMRVRGPRSPSGSPMS